MELQVGVKILLKNYSGKYLLVRRSNIKYPQSKPKWDLVGGRIKPSSPLIVNLRREVREETGLRLKGEVHLLAAQDILRIKGRHVVRLSYLGEIEGTPKLDLEENTEYGWFSFDELKKLPGKSLDEYFGKILKNLKP